MKKEMAGKAISLKFELTAEIAARPDASRREPVGEAAADVLGIRSPTHQHQNCSKGKARHDN